MDEEMMSGAKIMQLRLSFGIDIADLTDDHSPEKSIPYLFEGPVS
jgi:hypothetical protein